MSCDCCGEISGDCNLSCCPQGSHCLVPQPNAVVITSNGTFTDRQGFLASKFNGTWKLCNMCWDGLSGYGPWQYALAPGVNVNGYGGQSDRMFYLFHRYIETAVHPNRFGIRFLDYNNAWCPSPGCNPPQCTPGAKEPPFCGTGVCNPPCLCPGNYPACQCIDGCCYIDYISEELPVAYYGYQPPPGISFQGSMFDWGQSYTFTFLEIKSGCPNVGHPATVTMSAHPQATYCGCCYPDFPPESLTATFFYNDGASSFNTSITWDGSIKTWVGDFTDPDGDCGATVEFRFYCLVGNSGGAGGFPVGPHKSAWRMSRAPYNQQFNNTIVGETNDCNPFFIRFEGLGLSMASIVCPTTYTTINAVEISE